MSEKLGVAKVAAWVPSPLLGAPAPIQIMIAHATAKAKAPFLSERSRPQEPDPARLP